MVSEKHGVLNHHTDHIAIGGASLARLWEFVPLGQPVSRIYSCIWAFQIVCLRFVESHTFFFLSCFYFTISFFFSFFFGVWMLTNSPTRFFRFLLWEYSFLSSHQDPWRTIKQTKSPCNVIRATREEPYVIKWFAFCKSVDCEMWKWKWEGRQEQREREQVQKGERKEGIRVEWKMAVK